MTTLLVSCSHVTPRKINKPDRPPVRKVGVINGCVCGDALDELVRNWVDLNGYADLLEISGCFNKKTGDVSGRLL